MEPITLALLGAGGYYAWKKNKNPEWSPLAWLSATPLDKAVALERVKVASVPTPASTAALDPGMSTHQVRAVNAALTSETDPGVIRAHADALDSLGHTSSAAALDAKATAVGEAKALGASDADIHVKQLEAQAPAAAVGWGQFHFGAPPEVFEEDFVTGIQSGPAIVGIQSGPAIVGWDGYSWPHHHHHHRHKPWWEQYQWPEYAQQSWVGLDGRRGRGRGFAERGRGFAERGRGFAERAGRRRYVAPHEMWQHHHHRRHFVRPEEMEPMPEPEPEPEPEIMVPPPEHHHHHHHEPPPPPPPEVSITPGNVTNGDFLPSEWPEEFVGIAQYGGGGLVAEFPGTPQQAQPYGAPVGQPQYGQQYMQPQYGADLFQEYADAIEPQLDAYYQQYQQPYYPQYQPYYARQRLHYRHPWGGGGRRFRRW